MNHRASPTRFASARCHGLALINLMVFLTIVAVISLLTTWVFNGAMRANKQAITGEKMNSDWRAASDLMRQDTWNAATIKLVDDRTVDLTDTGGRIIRWQREIEKYGAVETNTLSRFVLAGDGPEALSSRQWIEHGWTGTFAVDGPVLTVKIPSSGHLPATELHLISQLQIVRGGDQ